MKSNIVRLIKMNSRIPDFPKFKRLELVDRKEIEFITQQFEPYSDYNFVSLWSYDVKEEIQISKLNGNLVIIFSDYITNQALYSFLGNTSVENTIITLLEHAKSMNLDPKLKLIPETIILNNPNIASLFDIQEDRDNFDHIFLTEEMGSLSGSRFDNKRNKVNSFKRLYPHAEYRLLSLSQKKERKNILEVFATWAKNKSYDDPEQTTHELVALKRLLNHSDKFDLVCLGIFDKNKLIAFSITEITHHGYAIFHFAKVNYLYKGIFEYLYYKTAQELYKKGSKLINREQDLGIPGLRTAKESWRPINFLKKYIISKK